MSLYQRIPSLFRVAASSCKPSTQQLAQTTISALAGTFSSTSATSVALQSTPTATNSSYKNQSQGSNRTAIALFGTVAAGVTYSSSQNSTAECQGGKTGGRGGGWKGGGGRGWNGNLPRNHHYGPQGGKNGNRVARYSGGYSNRGGNFSSFDSFTSNGMNGSRGMNNRRHPPPQPPSHYGPSSSDTNSDNHYSQRSLQQPNHYGPPSMLNAAVHPPHHPTHQGHTSGMMMNQNVPSIHDQSLHHQPTHQHASSASAVQSSIQRSIDHWKQSSSMQDSLANTDGYDADSKMPADEKIAAKCNEVPPKPPSKKRPREESARPPRDFLGRLLDARCPYYRSEDIKRRKVTHKPTARDQGLDPFYVPPRPELTAEEEQERIQLHHYLLNSRRERSQHAQEVAIDSAPPPSDSASVSSTPSNSSSSVSSTTDDELTMEDALAIMKREASKKEIRCDADLDWHLNTKPYIEKDSSRTNGFRNDGEAVAFKKANCACCNRKHIPRKNACHIIDRIDSSNGLYSVSTCMTLCNSCNILKGVLTLPEFLMHVQDTCSNIEPLIATFCREDGITSKDDLRQLYRSEDINLHPNSAQFRKTNESMTTERKGRTFDHVFAGERDMLVDANTQDCTNCKQPFCGGMDRQDSNVSYPISLLNNRLWPMCLQCNKMMSVFPYKYYLAKLLQIQDYVDIVGIGNVLSKGSIPLQMLVRVKDDGSLLQEEDELDDDYQVKITSSSSENVQMKPIPTRLETRSVATNDGRRFLSHARKQQRPVLVKIPGLDERVPFKSMKTADALVASLFPRDTIPLQETIDITPVEYRQYLAKHPEVVASFRRRMGVTAPVPFNYPYLQPFNYRPHLTDEILLEIEDELKAESKKDLPNSKAQSKKKHRTKADYGDGPHSRDTHTLVPASNRGGIFADMWACFEKFDEDEHPELKGLIKCTKCDEELRAKIVTNERGHGSLGLTDECQRHAGTCQQAFRREEYNFEQADENKPPGFVAPPEHYRSKRWNEFYFFEKDVVADDHDSFKRATHVYCKYCKQKFALSGTQKTNVPSHTCVPKS